VNNNGNANNNNASNVNGISPDFVRIKSRLIDNRISQRKRKIHPSALAENISLDVPKRTLLAW
jgi:hypothetical protein